MERVTFMNAISRKSLTQECASCPSHRARSLQSTRVPVWVVHRELIQCFDPVSADLVISWQSFDHGYFLTVRAIQELRDKKRGPVLVGIGGPSGSGKSRLVNSAEALKYLLLFLLRTGIWTICRRKIVYFMYEACRLSLHWRLNDIFCLSFFLNLLFSSAVVEVEGFLYSHDESPASRRLNARDSYFLKSTLVSKYCCTMYDRVIL